ncbi:MAG: hypothetical protein GY862_26960 [Gammaproteobacteria bacterium]|nr:hypothetical protein [Gammaproteobacteria bacterium]MCP5013834.1 hypothetical protein [Ketobacter sp.]
MAKVPNTNTSGTPHPVYDLGASAGVYRYSARPPVASSGLFDVVANPLEYAGGYFLDPSASAANPDGAYYAGRTRICLGSADDRIFSTAHSDGNSGTRWFSEWRIPAIVNEVATDNWNVGARLQEYRFIETDFGEMSNPVIDGLYYNMADGKLILGFHDDYDSAGSYQWSHAHYANGNDLANSARTGPYNIYPSNPAHFAGQIIDLPVDWQGVFGGTHAVHNGIKMSIASRSSIGMNLAIIDAANPDAGVKSVLMDFPHGNNWATSIANLGGSGEPYTDLLIWNFLADVAGAFVIPGTDTLCYIGTNLDTRVANNRTVYKDIAENSSGQFVWRDGFNPYIFQGMQPYIWLFDLNDLARTITDPVNYPPHIHQPYYHGFIDIPGVDKRDGFQPRGAFLHRTTKQIHIAIERGGDSSSPGFRVMNIPGVSNT